MILVNYPSGFLSNVTFLTEKHEARKYDCLSDILTNTKTFIRFYELFKKYKFVK